MRFRTAPASYLLVAAVAAGLLFGVSGPSSGVGSPVGSFIIKCNYSGKNDSNNNTSDYLANLDPIGAPFTSPTAHQHMFFGNMDIVALANHIVGNQQFDQTEDPTLEQSSSLYSEYYKSNPVIHGSVNTSCDNPFDQASMWSPTPYQSGTWLSGGYLRV